MSDAHTAQTPLTGGLRPGDTNTNAAAPQVVADPVVEEGWANFAKAQAEFAPIKMDKENPHFKSRYASIKATLAATRPALNKYGLVVTTRPKIDGEEIVAVTQIVYKGRVLVSGEWPVAKRTMPPQPQGSANTYARRYSIQDLLGVAAEEDDDGNAAQDATEGRGDAPKHNFRKATPSTQPGDEPKPESDGFGF